MPRTEIDIPAVVAIGAKVDDVAAGMDAVSAEIHGWAYLGLGAVEGSSLCAGDLSYAADSWAREIQEMAVSVRQYGADLKVTAEAYALYDRMSAQELRRESYQ